MEALETVRRARKDGGRNEEFGCGTAVQTH